MTQDLYLKYQRFSRQFHVSSAVSFSLTAYESFPSIYGRVVNTTALPITLQQRWILGPQTTVTEFRRWTFLLRTVMRMQVRVPRTAIVVLWAAVEASNPHDGRAGISYVYMG